MGNLAIWDYLAMVAYLGIMIVIGARFAGGKATSESYLLGGRALPWWAIGVSTFISLMSTISLVAVPGEVFNHGITLTVFGAAFGIGFGIPAFFLFTRFYFMTKSFTPFEYLERRFDHRVRLIGSVTWCLVRLMYMGIVLYSSAVVFQGASNWPVWLTILIVGLIGTFYTYMGGMKAVVWTDLLQFVVMFGGLIWIITECISAVPGGASGIIEYAIDEGRGFQAIDNNTFFSFNPYVRLTLWGMLLAAFFESVFTYSADQLQIQRLLSTSSYQMARRSYFLFLAVFVPMISILLFIGMGVFAFYGTQGRANQVNGDSALFELIATQLPSPAPGIILSAMLAAVMSTLDSTMNSLATVSVKDIYLRYVSIHASESRQVSLSKKITLLTGIIAICLAMAIAALSSDLEQTFIEVGAIWMSLVAVLAPLFLVGVTTTRVGTRHVLQGVLIGWGMSLAYVIWYLIGKKTSGAPSFMYVSISGSLAMTMWCYLPVILRRPSLPGPTTKGLTIWTLPLKRNTCGNEHSPVQPIADQDKDTPLS